MMAIGAGLIGAACLLILAARGLGAAGYSALVIATIVVAVGECFHTAALMPLVADLAPAHLRGRYMAAMGLSWWTGLAVAPTLGAQALGASATATFLGAALAAGAASASMLALDRRLPVHSRLTPRPEPAGGAEPLSAVSEAIGA
jgi:MFS family permease